MESNWILRPPAGADDRPRPGRRLFACRLFCIPQAGTGAWCYNALAKHLGDYSIEVLPIELPGRNSRRSEPAETCLIVLAQKIADVIESFLLYSPGPYALFGHSMGAWVGYETVQELMRRGLPPPAHLYGAANRAPQLSGANHDLDQTRLSRLEPEPFFEALTRRYGHNPSLESPAVRQLCYPTLKADFELVENYQYARQRCMPIVCHLTAIGAEQDNRYTKEQVEAWSHLVAENSNFRVVWLPNVGHNFIASPPPLLYDLLIKDLSGGNS